MTIACRVAACLVIVLVAATASAQSASSLDEVLTKLRAGGHVIVLRHGAAHADQADTDPLNLDNVAKQRQLNDKGRKPDGSGGYALVGRVQMGQWATLK